MFPSALVQGYSPTLQATVRDLYAQKDLGVFIGSFTGSVDIHDGLALKVGSGVCPVLRVLLQLRRAALHLTHRVATVR